MVDVRLTGYLVCANEEEARIVTEHLPEHIALTRAEPGCLSFDVRPTPDPLLWLVDERFRDEADFTAHQTRTAASPWSRATAGIERRYATDVGPAYSRRAAEYIELFGEVNAAHPSDRQLITTWADTLEGSVIDAGCGPGHWTDLLARRGLDARGVDQVPEFIERARSSYPEVPFTLGSLNTLDAENGSVGGVLAWYSLIHHEPGTIRIPLLEFHRVLRPGGGLLIGFLEGPVLAEYAHAVAPASLWPVADLSRELQAAGFEVIESHVREVAGTRSEAAIVARAAV